MSSIALTETQQEIIRALHEKQQRLMAEVGKVGRTISALADDWSGELGYQFRQEANGEIVLFKPEPDEED